MELGRGGGGGGQAENMSLLSMKRQGRHLPPGEAEARAAAGGGSSGEKRWGNNSGEGKANTQSSTVF